MFLAGSLSQGDSVLSVIWCSGNMLSCSNEQASYFWPVAAAPLGAPPPNRVPDAWGWGSNWLQKGGLWAQITGIWPTPPPKKKIEHQPPLLLTLPAVPSPHATGGLEWSSGHSATPLRSFTILISVSFLASLHPVSSMAHGIYTFPFLKEPFHKRNLQTSPLMLVIMLLKFRSLTQSKDGGKDFLICVAVAAI